MKNIIIAISFIALFVACGGGDNQPKAGATPNETTNASSETNGNPSYDPKRGTGKYTSVPLGDKLDKSMAATGKAAYDVKCAGCHKLTDERLVGPGWKDVTKNFTPEWIMNFMTNTAEMLDKDPRAQAQLEICLVRMPNQNLSEAEARGLLEFMRENDGVK